MEIKGTYTYEYPRPAVVIDCVVFGWTGHGLDILLIERAHDPWKGDWATPGGFVEIDETCETAAARELEEEAGLTNIDLIQFHTFSEVNRDPRGRVISVAYLALVDEMDVDLFAGSDAASANWFPVTHLPRLAADHDQIIQKAWETLQLYILHSPQKLGKLGEVVQKYFAESY